MALISITSYSFPTLIIPWLQYAEKTTKSGVTTTDNGWSPSALYWLRASVILLPVGYLLTFSLASPVLATKLVIAVCLCWH